MFCEKAHIGIIKFNGIMPKERKRDIAPMKYTFENIMEVVSEYTKISEVQIKGKKRTRDISFARHLVGYFCMLKTRLTYTTIGQQLGKRHHSTVLHSVKCILDWIITDAQVKVDVENIDKILN